MQALLKLTALATLLSCASSDKVALGGALDPLHRQVQPDVTDALHPLRPVKLTVTNKVGKPMHAIVITEQGDPSIGNSRLVHGKMVTTIPKLSAGHITLGHDENDLGSKIEISNDGPPAPSSETEIYVNISYVDGYSVPIVCHCGGKTTGCAKDLFKLGNCPAGQRTGPVCLNTAGDNGPAEEFFRPCRNHAYVYANQGGHGTGMYCNTYEIECCVGAKCGGNSRRDADEGSDIADAMAKRRGLLPSAEGAEFESEQ